MTSAAPAPLRLSAGDPQTQALAAGKVVLVLGGEPTPVELTVPAGPVSTQDILPVLQGLSQYLAETGAAKATAAGRTISCRAGCGACCRQLVPVATSEAHALAALVEAMPQPRRAAVRRRFDDALEALRAAGMIERLNRMDGPMEALGLDYFRLGVPCPFLQDEACSIHPDRPLACREYLVTSPAENCRVPSAETIEKVALDASPSGALNGAGPNAWLPMIFALGYAERELPEPRERPAADVLREIFARL